MPDKNKALRPAKPAVTFFESMVRTSGWLKPFVVDCLNLALAQSKNPNAPLKGWIGVNVRSAENQPVSHVILDISVAPPRLASEIVLAAEDGRLRVEPRQVASIYFLQPRIVLFIDDRIVGQLFPSLSGKHLEFVVAELSEACDLGNGVVALEELNYEVHVC
jgi:hypothetical protein